MKIPACACNPGTTLAMAIALALVAPACLAQETAAAPSANADPEAPASLGDAPADGERSPFGQVMSLLIAALQDAADEPDGNLQPGQLQLHLATPAAGPGKAPDPVAPEHRDIQVSSRFKLGGEPSAVVD